MFLVQLIILEMFIENLIISIINSAVTVWILSTKVNV